ncbi:MAG: hypothetical protein EBZ42_11205 [Betaproteobacteria bacterium]|nr:hypothetical protein [Betaproteobacteria bacterium]
MSKHALLRLALPATVLMAGTINLHAQTTPSGDSWQAGLVLDGAGLLDLPISVPVFILNVVTRDLESAVASGTSFFPAKLSTPNLR